MDVGAFVDLVVGTFEDLTVGDFVDLTVGALEDLILLSKCSVALTAARRRAAKRKAINFIMNMFVFCLLW
jgi:hypothetical protein